MAPRASVCLSTLSCSVNITVRGVVLIHCGLTDQDVNMAQWTHLSDMDPELAEARLITPPFTSRPSL